MSDFKDLSRIEETISEMVSDSIQRKDYSKLAEEIQKEVNKFVGSGDLRRSADGGRTDGWDQRTYTSRTSQGGRNGDGNDRQPKERARTSGEKKKLRRRPAPFMAYKPNKAKGITITGVGVFGALIFLNSAMQASGNSIMLVVTGEIAGAFAAIGVKGFFDWTLTNRFYKYGALIGKREYIDISELAELAGESEKEVEKNLEKMMEKNMLPKARFDSRKKTLILTEDAYRMYMDALTSAQHQKEMVEESGMSKEVRGFVAEGESFVREIHRANDAIAEKEMSDKLDRLEKTVDRVFDQVRDKPSSAGDLRKFMNYYIPTTRKLIDAYVDLDSRKATGANVEKTKKEIREAIDAVSGACDVILDDMFQNVAWDISSDISVMKTMMERDGLTGQSAGSAAGMQNMQEIQAAAVEEADDSAQPQTAVLQTGDEFGLDPGEFDLEEEPGEIELTLDSASEDQVK